MPLHIPYARTTFRPALKVNADTDRPVEFDLVPPEGPDLARLKSVIFGAVGLTESTDWSPATQEAVIAALAKGRDAFTQTIEAVRHLTVPAALARRVGLIEVLPETVFDGVSAPDPEAPVAVRTGADFARICGFVPTLAFMVAVEVVGLANKAEVDLRFFDSPSGSGSPATPAATPSTARSARSTSRRRATAGVRSKA